MADLNLNELRATAQRLAGRTRGLKGDRLTIERAIAGDHFAPEVVLALLDRGDELEAKAVELREFMETYHEQWMLNAAVVRRVEALVDHDGTVFTDDIRDALKDDSDD